MPIDSEMRADSLARMAGPNRVESSGVSLRVNSVWEMVHRFGKDAREPGDFLAGLTNGDSTQENVESAPTGRGGRSVRSGDRFEPGDRNAPEPKDERSRLLRSGSPPLQARANRAAGGREGLWDGPAHLPVGSESNPSWLTDEPPPPAPRERFGREHAAGPDQSLGYRGSERRDPFPDCQLALRVEPGEYR